MMKTLAIASWGLAIGAMGQWAFYWRLFPLVPSWVIMGSLFILWLLVFTISFCNRPPFGPRPFRRSLMFVMYWYAVATLLAETLHLFMQPAPRGYLSLIVARILMYLFGSASFVVFIRACIVLRRHETEPDA